MKSLNEIQKFVEKHPLDSYYKKLQLSLYLYPYILNGDASHGYIAQILGIHKLSLIKMYNEVGLPLYRETKEEIMDEVMLFHKLKEEE